MQYKGFCVWLLLVITMVLRVIYSVECTGSSFLCISEKMFHCIGHNTICVSAHQLKDRSCFQFLAVVTEAPISIQI